MENKEKLQQLMQDEEFLKEIMVLETVEEVQQAFKEKGADISIEDLDRIRELITKIIESNYELTEEELEKVCGGGYLEDFIIVPIVTSFFKVIGNALGEKIFIGWLFKKLKW